MENRKHTNHHVFYLGILFFLIGIIQWLPVYGQVSPKLDELEAKIDSIQKTHQMPGLAMVVFKGSKPTFQYIKGVRSVDNLTPVTINDKWHLGSCTKNMTAILIAQLIDQGKLKWDSKLADLVGQDVQLNPALKPVTIGMLLAHQAGLVDVVDVDQGKLWPKLFDAKLDPVKGRDQLARAILKEAPNFKPGTKTDYSNSGYVILGWLIDQISGTSWEKFLQENIFQKLDMDSCGFGPSANPNLTTPDQPWGHLLEKNKLEAVKPDIKADNPPAMGPAATVHCSIDDWKKFLYEIQKGFLEQSNAFGLTDEILKKLFTKVTDSHFTYSGFLSFDRAWAKGTTLSMIGSNTMNYAYALIAPFLDEIFIIVTNSGTALAEEGIFEIAQLLAQMGKK